MVSHSRETIGTDWLQGYPPEIRRGLAAMGRRCPALFAAGGTVRDLLAGQRPRDLDLTVPAGGISCAHFLAEFLEGAFVPLDEAEDVGRVVWGDYTIDVAAFREGTASIEEDLGRRDFTVNALAVALAIAPRDVHPSGPLLDPTGGLADFAARRLRATSERIFAADPLRLLRAYRFAATLDFSRDEYLDNLIRRDRKLIGRTAAERIASELKLIMGAARPHLQVAAMAASGLLWEVLPELEEGVGVAQPASHHLDVFHHNLAALEAMAAIQQEPVRFFPGHGPGLGAFLEPAARRVRLGWAALFHDLGKPAVREIREGRITFYGHDRAGAERFAAVADRLRWSREEARRVGRLIELHMWPFHLLNARRKTGITPKACLRLVKAAGDELPGLFLLAMADSLAGAGEGKPPEMERDLAALYDQVDEVYRSRIKPVLEQPRLLTGHDLQTLFALPPGPLIGRLLRELVQAQVAGEATTRDEAARWVEARLRGRAQS
ncbi:MAG: HD domain-containing protein [Desulfobacteraceae bacterium]|nr:HD domain-containing protein [Desulfobacteraceae bacterium]